MNKLHGIFSLIIICISIAIGFLSVLFISPLTAIIYFAITLIASAGILYFYCLKCKCRQAACGHILPGKLTTFLPNRKTDRYSIVDIGMTSFAIAVIVLYPQYWLWKAKPLFVVFWTLLIIGVLDILLFVCKQCENDRCPICPGFKG